MAYIVDRARQGAGNFVDAMGSLFAPWAPDTGVSEWIAGGPTLNTQAKASTGNGSVLGTTAPTQNMSYATQSYGSPATPTSTNTSYSSPTPQPAPAGFNPMDRNQNPGEGWFYDAADGWKQTGGGNSVDNQLNSAYDDYYKSLDAQLASLGDQRSAQEQQAQSAYQQGLGTVNNQYQTTQQQLDSNRQKSLRDLSSNLQQSWRQGNVYLGAKGASDSSAAGQYAYALTKMGNQQRGDLQSQYDQNMLGLKTTYDTEIKNLEYSLQGQLAQISQWFAQAQQSLQGARGEAAKEKSNQALNYAMQLAQQAQQDAASRRSTLDQWAANNAKSFNELGGYLQQSGNFQATQPQQYNLFGGQQGGGGVSAGYGSQTDEKQRGIFGY